MHNSTYIIPKKIFDESTVLIEILPEEMQIKILETNLLVI